MPGSLSQMQTALVSNTVSTVIMGTNWKRRAITVFSPTGNRVTLSFAGPAVLDQGPTVQPGTTQLRMTVEDYGEMIQRGVAAIAATAPTQISWVEEMGY